jgi:DNA-directed RNA polymerase specialized sigma24 family protein
MSDSPTPTPVVPEEEEFEWERSPSIPRAVHGSEIPDHRILREIFRHYSEFREYVAQGNDPYLEHTYVVPVDAPSECPDCPRAKKEHEALNMKCVYCGCDMKRVTTGFNFWDLHRGLKELAPRKREAVEWNVIHDLKQKDVAKKMGITTVTVGQYVEHAFRQLISAHVIETKDEN